MESHYRNIEQFIAFKAACAPSVEKSLGRRIVALRKAHGMAYDLRLITITASKTNGPAFEASCVVDGTGAATAGWAE